MIDSLGVREARQNLRLMLDRAEQGTPTVITRNGDPVALVVPAGFFDFLLDLASAAGGWETRSGSEARSLETRKRELATALAPAV